MLRDVIEQRRHDILERVQARGVAPAVAGAIDRFLDHIVDALQMDRGCRDGVHAESVSASAEQYVPVTVRNNLDAASLVRQYGAICDAVQEVARETHHAVGPREFQIFNQCLDEAVATAVDSLSSHRENERERRHAEQLGALVHELRNALSAATMAFSLLRSGRVSLTGQTAAVAERSLFRMRELLEQSILESRLKAGAPLLRDRIDVAELADELVEDVAVLAGQRGVTVVSQIDSPLEVEADRRLLRSAIANLVHNAVKFTRPRGSVKISGWAEPSAVLLSVEDECGGLPAGRAEELFRPYVQAASDRSGLGLGLAITRQAIVAHGGAVDVRNQPGHGCTFVVRLPCSSQGRH